MNIPDFVKDIMNKVEQAGFQIYIVGGAVRDLLMKRTVHDWDFTTDAKPEEILKIFPDGFYDNKFGTVGIPVADFVGDASRGAPSNTRNAVRMSDGADERQDPQNKQVFEITTMRKEGKYEDFRHPSEVGWTNKIEEDLSRRDFTINAMAINSEGNIIDPFMGQIDLKTKLIKVVGNPNLRFTEDALRLIRAIRIATELEFEIETKTFLAIQKNAELINEVAYERIRDELFKLLASTNPRLPKTEQGDGGQAYIGTTKLREAGILQIILPEVEKCFGVAQEGPKHDRIYDIGEHSFLTLKTTPSEDPLVRFAALLHDIGKPATFKTDETGNVTFYNHEVVGGRLVLEITKRFNMSKKQTDKLYRLVRWHQFSVDDKQTDSAIRRFINNVGIENVDDAIALRIGDRLGGGTEKAVSWRMEKFQDRIREVLKKPFSIADLKINGKDVMEVLNIPAGPKVGEVLNKLFEEVLEDASKNNRVFLFDRLKHLT